MMSCAYRICIIYSTNSDKLTPISTYSESSVDSIIASLIDLNCFKLLYIRIFTGRFRNSCYKQRLTSCNRNTSSNRNSTDSQQRQQNRSHEQLIVSIMVSFSQLTSRDYRCSSMFVSNRHVNPCTVAALISLHDSVITLDSPNSTI